MKVTEVSGDFNDEIELFIFAGPEVPATEPGTADAVGEYSGSPGTNRDIAVGSNAVQTFFFRNFSGNGPGPWQMDELRAGSTWADVTSDPNSVGDWQMYN